MKSFLICYLVHQIYFPPFYLSVTSLRDTYAPHITLKNSHTEMKNTVSIACPLVFAQDALPLFDMKISVI